VIKDLLILLSLFNDIMNAFGDVKTKCFAEDVNIIRVELVKNGERAMIVTIEFINEEMKRVIYERILSKVCKAEQTY